jgi:type IV pilus biogenesis protein CpaD/CtpE
MARTFEGICLGALIAAATVITAVPASAEFFGCNDKPGKVLATYTDAPRYRAKARYTHELAAQSARPRITVYPRQTRPGRAAQRHCRSWVAKEYRVSGPVIVPRTQCWWQ